jgi:hypothetical protein
LMPARKAKPASCAGKRNTAVLNGPSNFRDSRRGLP